MGKERPSSREREVPGGKSRYRPPGGEAVEVWSVQQIIQYCALPPILLLK
jgi:hypothetical protein